MLILIGTLQITLGGVGISGFFSLRDFYFLTSNTFEAFIKLFTGIVLLNVTIRKIDLKNRILLFAAIIQVGTLMLRNYQYSTITTYELYFSLFLIALFILLVILNRNDTNKNIVK